MSKVAQKLGCCERFKTKRRACKNCPLLASLSKKQRRRLLEKYRD